jgi:hypothetical protein
MNDEFQMTNDERTLGSKRAFRFRVSDLIRHSSFVIRHCVPLALFLLPRSAHACAVCFGNSDSKLTKGMLAGVLVLLLVVLSVLGGFAALFIYLARRAAATAALDNQSTESKA